MQRFVFVLVCVAIGCSKDAPADPCGLDRETIATWLTSAKVGPKPRDANAVTRWDDERYQFRVALEEPTFDAWCSARAGQIDSACWTAAGDLRPECKQAREQVWNVPVTGPLCEMDSKWLFSVWHVEESGTKYDLATRDGYEAWIAAAIATYNSLDSVPIALICTQTGGFPLNCYRSNTERRCRIFANAINYWLQAPR